MTKYRKYYCELIEKLAHLHAHPKNKRKAFLVKKKFQGTLDFKEVDELLEEASDELEFIHRLGEYVWMAQDREMLEYIRDECSGIKLWAIGRRFGHLDPPSLRDEFGLPPRQY